VTLAHPEGYRLLDECMDAAKTNSAAGGGSFKVVHSMDEAFKDADVVYPKSWGPMDLMLERVTHANDGKMMGDIEKRALERNAKHKDWICDERRMGLTAGGKALYMHCLPADIGAEVSASVMEKAKVDVAREANWKMYVIMAVIAGSKVKDLGKKLAARWEGGV
jgi:ornithine carbamoyltransferase